VGEGDCVEAVQDLQVEDERDGGQGEEEGDHQPGAVESVGQDDAAIADGEACSDDTQGDERAELGDLLAANLGEVDFLGSRDGADIAHRSVGEGGEEEPA